MLKRNLLVSCLFICCIYFISSCNSFDKKKSKDQVFSPPGYELASGKLIKMPPELDEISGLSFYAKDSAVFAINDEKGILYKIFLDKDKDLEKWRFSKGADFEDLAVYDSTFYILQSKGGLFKVKFLTGDSLQTDTINLPVEGKNEFEILYVDQKRKQLIMICKDCAADHRKQVTAYGYDPVADTTKIAFEIDEQSIRDLLGSDDRFKPSAAAINPITHELYIISAVNKALIVCDTDGKVHAGYKLDPKVFKQPEGITFTNAGDMLISNEAANKGAADILFFEYKMTSK